jgi:hypothetical protein
MAGSATIKQVLERCDTLAARFDAHVKADAEPRSRAKLLEEMIRDLTHQVESMVRQGEGKYVTPIQRTIKKYEEELKKLQGEGKADSAQDLLSGKPRDGFLEAPGESAQV